MAEPPAPEERGALARASVPYRVILATIAMVLATFVAFELIISLRRILTWLIIAGFFAVVLHPAVDFGVRKLHMRRTLAAMLVFLLGFATLAGLLYVFIRPIINEANNFSDDFPHFVNEAKAGRGPVGGLVKRYHIDRWVDQNQDKLKTALQNSGNKALDIAKKVGTTAAALGTILVLTFLLLIEGPRMLASGVGMLSPPRQDRLRRVGRDAARAVTSYMAGNLLISLIAAVVTFTGLWIFGVPFRMVIAVWVGFADMIPLIGATLGAIPAVAIAFLHSTTAGFGMIILYVVYQQFENHVLQVGIMARTVKLSPLVVLVSLLAGVQLSGLLGALLAIPAAGIIQVVTKDIYQERQRRKALVATPSSATTQVTVDSAGTTEVTVTAGAAANGALGDHAPDSPPGDDGAPAGRAPQAPQAPPGNDDGGDRVSGSEPEEPPDGDEPPPDGPAGPDPVGPSIGVSGSAVGR
jgi:predicted PurR-regulated permease PerM